jgi:4-hydroxy-2-oxoheptanedioate aldolase
MANRLKDKFKAGKPAFGVWIEFMSPELAEFCGYLGYEYAVIDGEHFALDPAICLSVIRACEVSGMVPIVRVPYNHPGVILSYLEVGALGIYVPHVNTADDAKAIVDAVKYAPQGHRGAGSGRYLKYGLSGLPPGQAQQRMNDDTIVIALVEEVAGIRNLDAIIATEGVDVVGLGSGDLSHSMGLIGQKDHPDVVKAVVDAEHRIAQSGKVFDSVVYSLDEARDCVNRGSLMVSFAVRGVLRNSLGGFLKELSGATQAAAR